MFLFWVVRQASNMCQGTLYYVSEKGGCQKRFGIAYLSNSLSKGQAIFFIFISPCFLWLHTVIIHLYIFSNSYICANLTILYFLVISERPRALIGELNSTEILLRILQEYDMLSKTWVLYMFAVSSQKCTTDLSFKSPIIHWQSL